MKIGFTGTRKGMTNHQVESLIVMLKKNWHDGSEFHHGDCIGADFEANMIAIKHGYNIIIHPPINEKLRAFCSGDIILEPKDYLTRNKDIVNMCDILIACPATFKEELRSGTWSTIRYAMKMNKYVRTLLPHINKGE